MLNFPALTINLEICTDPAITALGVNDSLFESYSPLEVNDDH
jgi:hypothetical protein